MLIGRAEDERVVEELVAAARLGHSGVLVVAGEAGIGKSELLARAAERAQGFQVLRVTGTEQERDLPFAGLAQLLGPLSGCIDDLPPPQAEALAVALALRAGGEVDRFAVAAAVLGLVTRAAERRPVAVLADDAHLLDRPSAEALAFVARRLVADAVVLLVSVRAGEGSAWTDGGLPQHELRRLSAEHSAQLALAAATVPLSREELGRVLDLADGNPLALRTLAARPTPVSALPVDVPAPVPTLLAAAFGRELAQLTDDELSAVRVAAVCGGDLAVTARVCGEAGDGVQGLARAEALGLVRVAGSHLEFAHPLVRSAVYAGIPADERRSLHEGVAAALPDTEPDRRAWHLSAAALGPDESVAIELDAVGSRAERRGAYAVAASARARAAELSWEAGDRAERILAAGRAAWFAGEHERAEVLLGEAVDHGDARVRARARATLGMVAARRGPLSRAQQLLRHAAEQAEVEAPDEALELYAELIDVSFLMLDTTEGSRAANRIELLLRPRWEDDPTRAEAVAEIAVGVARILRGRPGAEEIRRGAAALASRPSAGPPTQVAWEVVGPLFLRERDAGRDLMVRALDQRREASALGTMPHLLFRLARWDATSDRWARAEASYGEAVGLAAEFGQRAERAASLAGLTWVLARQGRADDARRSGGEALALATEAEVRLAEVWTRFALAELDLSLGDAARAVEQLGELDALLREHDMLDPDISPVPELVEALLRVGEGARAAAVARDFLRRAEEKGQPWSLARAARVRVMVGDDPDASFGAALRWHADTTDGFEVARTQLLRGEQLRRDRRRAAAREHLRAALEAFDRLGARVWADVAMGELDATGLSVHRRETGPVVDLTPRELQIALLLAEGRTTRETAQALFLSPKTVEYHLRHVYNKLGIATRAELRERIGELES